jgi:hypothetical protein
MRGLLVSKDGQHLFVTPCLQLIEVMLRLSRQVHIPVNPVISMECSDPCEACPPATAHTHTGERVAQGERDAYQRHLIVFS